MRKLINADVSELADETDSKSVIRKGVWVRVPPSAPNSGNPNLLVVGDWFGFFYAVVSQALLKNIKTKTYNFFFDLHFYLRKPFCSPQAPKTLFMRLCG